MHKWKKSKLNILDKLTYKNKFNSTHDNRRFAKNLENTIGNSLNFIVAFKYDCFKRS